MQQSGLRNAPGVYAVFEPQGDCLYVGASIRLLDRVMQHWRRHWGIGGKTVWLASGADFRNEENHPIAPDGSVLKVWFTDEPKILQTEKIQKLKPKFNRRLD